MNDVKIMVVEDDAPIRNLITTTLKAHNYEYIAAKNGEEAIIEVTSHNPDIMLLDLGLPDMDGEEIIRSVRQWSDMPIIVISARSEETDMIDALDAGADDYLTKPFSIDELLARVRVAARRLARYKEEKREEHSSYRNGELFIDYAAGYVTLCGKELHLTPIEYKLLVLLSKNTGKIMTHKFITKEIWGSGWESNVASLRVFMASLRKKLETDGNGPQYIRTHVGVGYRMMKIGSKEE